MEFCPKCGAVLVSKKYVEKDGEKTAIFCRKCGYTKKKYKPIEIKE
ncbi:MAG: DNA-directed RNA polymerase subunit M, partial [Candidatus Micrarchaeota archaeon]|nr:DNA-directed RNA polymerase subunit M [Candidatus Micrarchaeota archaeon]